MKSNPLKLAFIPVIVFMGSVPQEKFLIWGENVSMQKSRESEKLVSAMYKDLIDDNFA